MSDAFLPAKLLAAALDERFRPGQRQGRWVFWPPCRARLHLPFQKGAEQGEPKPRWFGHRQPCWTPAQCPRRLASPFSDRRLALRAFGILQMGQQHVEREFDAGQIAGRGPGQFVEEMALVFVGQTRRCHGRDRGGPGGQLAVGLAELKSAIHLNDDAAFRFSRACPRGAPRMG